MKSKWALNRKVFRESTAKQDLRYLSKHQNKPHKDENQSHCKWDEALRWFPKKIRFISPFFNCVAFIYKVLKPRNRCTLTSSLDLSITLTVLFGVRSLKLSICSSIKWFQRCYFTVYSQCLVIQTELHKKMLLGLNFHKPCGVHSNEVKNVNQTWCFVSLFTNPFSIQIHCMWRHHNGCFSQTDDALPQLSTYFM